LLRLRATGIPPRMNGNTLVSLRRRPAELAFYGFGTWDTGSLKLELSPAGGSTWYDAATALTATGVAVIANTGQNHQFRVDLSSAGASTDLNWKVYAAQ